MSSVPPPSWTRGEGPLLAQLHSGYCNVTQDTEKGCRSGWRQGYWELSPADAEGWASATQACVGRCKSCEACAAISVSLRAAECGWFARCDLTSLQIRPYGFRTLVMGSSPLAANFTRRSDQAQPPAAAARGRRLRLRCRSSASSTINVSKWHVYGGVGNRFEAVLNALQAGACCGARVLLPRDSLLWDLTAANQSSSNAHGEPLRAPCFDFRRQPQQRQRAALQCAELTRTPQNAKNFFYKDLNGCFTAADHRGDAQLAGATYVGTHPSLACAAAGEEGLADTLYAHVRTGEGRSGHPHPDYGQPPAAYYLAAWRASGLRRLRVVTGDAGCPVVRALLALRLDANVSVQNSSDFATDLRTLLCARHVVLAHSTLSTLVLGANRMLHTVYSYRPPPPNLWTASCAVSYLYTDGVRRAEHWRGTPSQQRELIYGGMDRHIWFQQATRPPCLGLLHGPEHAASRVRSHFT